MGKKVAILQSNYIPWKGYFDIINSVDEFVIYDSEQYTKRDWRNRNLIKTPSGLQWLTVPVEVKGRYLQRINETKIADKSWGAKHWKSISLNYSRANYFDRYSESFKTIYLDACETNLSRLNFSFISLICGLLKIKTKISWSTDYSSAEGKNEKLLIICKEAGATDYLSGPSARSYLDSGLFRENNIEITWVDYTGYPEYNQLYPPFAHGVSIIDLILNEGPNSINYLKSFK